MSRIGKMPIDIPTSVTVSITPGNVAIKGPKGSSTFAIPHGIEVVQQNNQIIVSSNRHDRPGKSLFGFVRAQLANDVTGLTAGFSKTLEMVGVGYRAAVTGQNLVLNVGYSHPVTIVPPAGIIFTLVEGKIVVTGNNKQVVGQVAANVRAVKEPEPYKGKGIRYVGEHVRKKAGKAAKAVGGK